MTISLSTADSIALLGSAATAVTAVVAVIAVVYARGQVREAQKQLQQSRKLAHGDFLLRLDEAFQRHDEIHKWLQPAFQWGKENGRSKSGPESAEDWFMVTQYMGLFERVTSLLKNEITDLSTVDKYYGYRLYNIVSNDTIRQEKLENKRAAAYWEDFIDLWLKVKDRHNDWEAFPEVRYVRSH
jgi:hypothetical protein